MTWPHLLLPLCVFQTAAVEKADFQPADGKLEEARKIQQLLASLGGAVAAPTPPQQPAASTPHFSPMSQYPPLPSQSYGPQASSPYAPAQPTYSGPNPSHSTPQQNQPHYSPPAPVGAPAGVTIPPNVLSMMQAPSQAPPQQYGQSGGGYGSNPAPPPATSIGSLLQQLVSFRVMTSVGVVLIFAGRATLNLNLGYTLCIDSISYASDLPRRDIH